MCGFAIFAVSGFPEKCIVKSLGRGAAPKSLGAGAAPKSLGAGIIIIIRKHKKALKRGANRHFPKEKA